jgi:hypothetical protein
MKIFHCDHCDQPVFFENFRCVSCEHALAYIPELADLKSLEPAGENLWKCAAGKDKDRTYRLCDNYTKQNVCNWAIPSDDTHTLCEACRLTHVIPDLDVPSNLTAWYKLEVAKRRLVYSLLSLQLPVTNKIEDEEHGLSFEFLADRPPEPDSKEPPKPVLTGHADGVIVINIAEADDAEREKRRQQMHEPYRTLLGHFRHEVGHYYWDRLIRDTEWLEPFREKFGDESADYGEALKAHYKNGAPADWQANFVSTYATSHPWEDWAETWAHYLHMVDTLETAAACGVSLRPKRKTDPTIKVVPDPKRVKWKPFEEVIDAWFPLTYVLNNLNRGLGQGDAYPFVLSTPVIEKLRFIHSVANSDWQAVEAVVNKVPGSPKFPV